MFLFTVWVFPDISPSLPGSTKKRHVEIWGQHGSVFMFIQNHELSKKAHTCPNTSCLNVYALVFVQNQSCHWGVTAAEDMLSCTTTVQCSDCPANCWPTFLILIYFHFVEVILIIFPSKPNPGSALFMKLSYSSGELMANRWTLFLLQYWLSMWLLLPFFVWKTPLE